MATPSNVWDARFQALETALSNYKQWLTAVQKPSPRGDILLCLLQRLQDFAHWQFNFFFYQGFASNRLATSDSRPPDYVYAALLDQVSIDFSVIQQAVAQCLPGYGDPEMAKTLDITDRLAFLALQPSLTATAKPFYLDPATTVVTYFKKNPSIRVIPYAPIALIGLPYTAIQVSKDWLSLPHEVAHYLYRHAKDTQDGIGVAKALEQQLKYLPHYVVRWTEEIFADVYGCRVAGPAFADSGQALQQTFTLDEFFADDGEHPAPVLRPYIYQKALNASWSKGAATVSAAWDNYRRDQQKKTATPQARKKQYKVHDWRWIDIDRIVRPNASQGTQPVDAIISAVLTRLNSLPAGSASTWSGCFDGTWSTEAVRSIALPGSPCLKQLPTVEETRNAALNKLGGDQPIPFEVWSEILRADGWATKWDGTAPRKG